MITSDNHSWVTHSEPARVNENRIDVRNAFGLNNVLPGFQMPPEIPINTAALSNGKRKE
jgi:hypothetical protein